MEGRKEGRKEERKEGRKEGRKQGKKEQDKMDGPGRRNYVPRYGVNLRTSEPDNLALAYRILSPDVTTSIVERIADPALDPRGT